MAGRFSHPLGEASVAQPLDVLMASTLSTLMPAERLRVRWTPPRTAVQIVWPPGVITRALVNIIRNALQASSSNLSVDVLAEADDRTVTIRVIDKGAGMSTAVLARAGEPFYTTKPQGEGTGLGLFVARSTIDQLGGTLMVTSSEGAGTTVTVSLPADLSGAPGI